MGEVSLSRPTKSAGNLHPHELEETYGPIAWEEICTAQLN